MRAVLARTQTDVENGAGHLARLKARIADKLAARKYVTQLHELRDTLEETQRLHVLHRDQLRKELHETLAGKNWPYNESSVKYAGSRR